MNVIALGRVVMCCMLLAAEGLASGTIRDVEFTNFSFDWPADTAAVPSSWSWLVTTNRAKIRLLNGNHSFDKPGVPPAGAPYVELSSITYGDLTGDGQDEAAVDLVYGTGGTAKWHYLYVYTLADGASKLLGILRSGSRAFGGLVNIGIAATVLVVDFQDEDRREGDCCSRGIIRVRYRLENGRFLEVGAREKDSLRVEVYPLMPTGPVTVRHETEGKAVNIVYRDASGSDRALTSSGVNTWPNLSSDKRAVVFLRELAEKQQEIWTVQTDGSGLRQLYAGPVRWNGNLCPSSSFRSPQWAVDGRAVYFVTDCSSTTGALWRLAIASRTVKPIIPDAVIYGVIQTGRFRGFLVSNQRSVPPRGDSSEPGFPAYRFFLYKPDGSLVRQVGDETDDLDELLARWENR